MFDLKHYGTVFLNVLDEYLRILKIIRKYYNIIPFDFYSFTDGTLIG